LETPGVKGCDAAASQMSLRGVADMDLSERGNVLCVRANAELDGQIGAHCAA
jgi:hypothetical protein